MEGEKKEGETESRSLRNLSVPLSLLGTPRPFPGIRVMGDGFHGLPFQDRGQQAFDLWWPFGVPAAVTAPSGGSHGNYGNHSVSSEPWSLTGRRREGLSHHGPRPSLSSSHLTWEPLGALLLRTVRLENATGP